MKVVEKVELAKKAIESISRHDDAEKDYVLTALDELQKFIGAEITAMNVRRQEKWKKEVDGHKEANQPDNDESEAE